MSGHTSKPLESVEFVAGGWGVYAEDGTLLAATFGEHAEARARLIIAAFDLTDKMREHKAIHIDMPPIVREAEATPVVVGVTELDSQPDFRCAIEQRKARHEGQNDKCATQCANCRTLEEGHAAANATADPAA